MSAGRSAVILASASLRHGSQSGEAPRRSGWSVGGQPCLAKNSNRQPWSSEMRCSAGNQWAACESPRMATVTGDAGSP